MENLEKYGMIKIESGKKAEEIIQILIQHGFRVSKEDFTFTHTQYLVFKDKTQEQEVSRSIKAKDKMVATEKLFKWKG